MKILNLRKSILYIAIALLLSFILTSLNCSRMQGIQSFHNKTPPKLVFFIKFELTGYGFEVIVNHTANEATNGESEMLNLDWTGKYLYSWSKDIKALEGETIFFKTIPKNHICSMQNTNVNLKITIKESGRIYGKLYIETSDPTSIWEEITLKRGMTNVQYEN